MFRVFQIAYSAELMSTREAVLRSRGYVVESVLGNEAAKKSLQTSNRYHLFIVGHAEARETRHEMVCWLRQNFPEAKVLALNPHYSSGEPEADYNVPVDAPEQWLDAVHVALG